MGQIELLENFLCRIGHALVFGIRLVGRGDGNHLDLAELVQAVEAPRGGAAAAGLTAEAVREGGKQPR